MTLRADAADDALLAELSRQAFASAATRLQVDPFRLARSLGDGRIAELLLELRSVSYWAHPRDRDRIEEILDEVHAAIRGRRRAANRSSDEGAGGRPAGPPEHRRGAGGRERGAPGPASGRSSPSRSWSSARWWG